MKDVLIKAEPGVEIMSFLSCDEALDTIILGIRPDVVFSEDDVDIIQVYPSPVGNHSNRG